VGFNIERFTAYKAATGRPQRVLRDKLIVENMGLVRKFAVRMFRQSSIPSDLEDLIQAGSIGLGEALETYDVKVGTAFSTWAAWKIRAQIQDCLIHESKMHRPRGRGTPYPIHLAAEKFKTLHGRDATPEDLGVSVEDWHRWRTENFQFVSTESTFTPAHEQASVSNAGGSQLTCGGAIADEGLNPEEQLEEAQENDRLHAALDGLDEREQRVIKGLFLDNKAYCDVAAEENLSKERVRQIRNLALEKMKAALVE